MRILVSVPRIPWTRDPPGPFRLDGDSGHQQRNNKKEWHLNDTAETTVEILHGS